MLIFYKQIDQSALRQGISIPQAYQRILMYGLKLNLLQGKSKNIKIELDGLLYDAVLRNQAFDNNKYKNHSDVVQIRYNPNSPIAYKLREKFEFTQNIIKQQIAAGGNARVSKLKESDKEYIAVYTTDQDNIISFDCICNNELREETQAISSLGELVAESILEGTDSNAAIVLRTRVNKIRRLSKSIGNDLKKAYGYRCQICGQYIGEKYGSRLIHAHHIDYFTNSLNNDASNVMIVCPNHHGIIHDQNPIFDRKNMIYKYPNGFREGLKLNYHLL